MLMKLDKDGDHFKPGQLVRANELAEFSTIENGDWKFLSIDEKGKLVIPKGTVGHRWEKGGGNWNMKLENEVDNKPYDPMLTSIEIIMMMCCKSPLPILV